MQRLCSNIQTAATLLSALMAGLLTALLVILWHGHNWEKAQLKRSKELADTANRAKSKFLANMSHELRTPLNGILGYTQILLRDRTASPAQIKQFQVIQQCGNHLLNLINDVLDIAKIEAERLELVPETFYLFPFLESLAEIFRMRAAQKGLSFEYEFDYNLPTKICGDPKRLRQVLMTLLSNAIKFTPAGRIDFRITSVVSLESLTETEGLHHIRFEVRDTGVGIEAQQLKKIFQPFEQIGHTNQRQDGTGLGLAISAQIVALMGSELQVTSTPGKGSVFNFEIQVPGFETQSCESRPSVQPQSIITGYSGPPYTILVVDDKWANRAVLVNLLQSIGFMTIEAFDGKDGMEKAVEYVPDLIITDLVMPRVDGFEFLRQLQQSPQLKDVVAIASSASVFEADQNQSLSAGAKAFLPKPVQADILLDFLETYLPLEWVYCTQRQPKSDSLQDSSSTALSPPLEHDILLRLKDLAEMGDVDAIEREAEKLKGIHPKASDFLQDLQKFAQNCQLDNIESLLVHYISVR